MKDPKRKLKTVDQLTSEEQQNTLETQAKALADATRTAIVKTEDVRIESIKHPQGERLAARARSGKFMSRTEASTMATTKETQTFLVEIDPETGLSRHKTLLNKLYDGAKKAADEPRALGNSVKAVELIDEIAGHRAAREEALSNKDHIQNPVKIVIISPMNLTHPEVIDGDKPQERPKQPSFAEVLDIRTNPPRE